MVSSELVWVMNLARIVMDQTDMQVIILMMFNMKEVDTSPSSPLFKAANKIYDMARKKKYLKKGFSNIWLS